MGQVAFDILQTSEELETAGISREQAMAISLVVRKSHEVADVATKRDLEDVHKEIDARLDKTDAQIADVGKDMAHRFEKTKAQISLFSKDLQLEMAGIRSQQKLMRWMLGFGVIGNSVVGCKSFRHACSVMRQWGR